MAQSSARSRHAGFSLPELAVVGLIALGALAALLHAAWFGLRGEERVQEHGQALARARSHLEAALARPSLQPGEWSGEEGEGLRWRLSVQAIGEAGGAVLYEIRVAVAGRREAGATLVTRQVRPAQPAASRTAILDAEALNTH